MPANTDPIFILTPNTVPVTLAAANTACDGTGAILDLVVAGAFGSRVDKVVFQNSQTAPAASSNMMCRIFVSDATGANWGLVKEIPQVAATRSATVAGAWCEWVFSPAYTLKPGQKMGVTMSVYAGVADRTTVSPYAGDF